MTPTPHPFPFGVVPFVCLRCGRWGRKRHLKACANAEVVYDREFRAFTSRVVLWRGQPLERRSDDSGFAAPAVSSVEAVDVMSRAGDSTASRGYPTPVDFGTIACVKGETMGFQISTLRRDRFDGLFGLGDEALARLGAKRYVADRKPGFPCRVTLQDAEPGERVILVPFEHQHGTSPYRASGPIFVRESASDATVPPNVVPDVLRTRLLSVRAYDAADLMVDADVADGREVEGVIERLLCDGRVRYLHVHFARPGCYACRIDRG